MSREQRLGGNGGGGETDLALVEHFAVALVEHVLLDGVGGGELATKVAAPEADAALADALADVRQQALQVDDELDVRDEERVRVGHVTHALLDAGAALLAEHATRRRQGLVVVVLPLFRVRFDIFHLLIHGTKGKVTSQVRDSISISTYKSQ